MNTALWIVQGILAAMMFTLGVMKSFLPIEKLNKLSWTTRNSEKFIRFVGVSELLIGLGLVLPWLTGVLPFLTSVAAASLCLVMLFAIAEHIRHKEARDIPKNVIIMLLALFVATGRFNHLIVI
ncbi:MAG: DoxX family protein [Bacteroidetes bacterium]|nr:DoxX family protein [Bacteroidota bacterium]